VSADLGVDLGATWLRACLVRDGRVLWTARAPAVPWRELPRALASLLRGRGAPRPRAIVVGGTRLGGTRGRAELRRALRPLCARPRVLTDFEIAHRAFFGRGPGVLLAASTGSVAFARGPRGRTARAGGWGPLLGDEGSAFWLGREGTRDPRLRARLRLPAPLTLAHAADPVRAVAALAPRVLSGAPRLRAAAAARLAALAREAAAGAGLRAPRPLALHGGLFRDARLKAEVLRRLGPGWRPRAARTDAARAAAGL
jgi:hypothetical protein